VLFEWAASPKSDHSSTVMPGLGLKMSGRRSTHLCQTSDSCQLVLLKVAWSCITVVKANLRR
jgi:hypothetical protein